MESLDDLASSSSSLVGTVELEIQQQRDDNDQCTSNQRGIHTRSVARGLVLFAEYCATNDSTNAASTDKGGRGKCTLPLSADIVGLPGKYGRDIGITSSGSEENAKIAHSNRLYETETAKTDEHKTGVGDDEGRADAVFVCVPGKAESDHGGEDVRGCNQALCITLVEAHAYFKDNREEIGNSISDGGREAEEGCKGPDLKISGALEILADFELFKGGIVAILFDCCDDKVNFLLIQELGSERDVGSLFGEVDNGEVGTDGEDTGDETLHDKDPAPACKTRSNALWAIRVKLVGTIVSTKSISGTQASHLTESVRENTRKGR